MQSFKEFDIKLLGNPRIFLTTETKRPIPKDFEWYRQFYANDGFDPFGLIVQAYLIKNLCEGNQALEAAVMERSKWFRIAKNGRDDLCIPLQKRQVKIMVRSAFSSEGWVTSKTDQRDFYERIVHDADEVDDAMKLIVKVLL